MDVEIYQGPLDISEITTRWYDEISNLNYGAFITFIGTVRDENGIDGLSFDIYVPILEEWFRSWVQKAKLQDAMVKMAHSEGDVGLHQSSFIAGIVSPKRATALKLIEEFVEDFKANAPIWKYDLVGGERVYVINRSTPMDGAGILKELVDD
jgi:molybdopterin synthase catalytic subunit